MTIRIYSTSILLAILFCTIQTADAAGFGLIEQSTSMGDGFAGGGAAAEDASTIYFNPAGMTYLPDSQLVIGMHAAKPSANFENQGSKRSASTGGLQTLGGNGGDAGSWAYIPNIYYAKAITSDIRLGIAISPLFGLKTDYDKNWVGRYQAIKSELKTININPSIAFKANDQLSLGFGVTAMRAEAELTNAVDFGTILASLIADPGLIQKRDGLATVKGDDWAWGWNMGGIFQLNEDTRVGLSYRSQIHETLGGTVSFGNVPSQFAGSPLLSSKFANGSITAKLVTPDNITASFLHNVNNQWDLAGDIIWTRWSKFKDLTIIRNTGETISSVPENWNNTVRVGLGTSYKYSSDTKFRAGVAYDESPIPDAFRTPRVPDSDRIWLSLGVNYKITPASAFDVAYTHIFFKNSGLNKVTDTTVPALRDTVRGNYDNYADILSAQYTYSF